MANDTVTGYTSNWNAAPVPGSSLITFSPTQYPFLSRISGIKEAQSDEYAMSAQYALEAFAQPAITEAGSTTAPTAVSYDRTNEVNAIQIFQKTVAVTYARQSAANRLRFAEVGTSGYAYSNDPRLNPVSDELAFQANAAKEQAYGDLEVSCLSGAYAKATSAAVANKMRGIATACTSNTVEASSAKLDRDMVDELLAEMATSGAKFVRPVIYANTYNKQQLTKIYEFVPMDRNRGGANIQMIETDFGIFEVVFNHNMPTSTILFADMAAVYLVTQPVPNKKYMPDGLFLLEELSKTGAAETHQLYGQLGLDYGSEKYHGTITGTATSD